MYGSTHVTAAMAGAGMIAATTDWTIVGWMLIGGSIATAVTMTTARLRQRGKYK